MPNAHSPSLGHHPGSFFPATLVTVSLFVMITGCQEVKKASVKEAPGDRAYRLAMVMTGLNNYHSAYRQLPYTVNLNSRGEETIGWRAGVSNVLSGGHSRFVAFDMNKPWDSPENLPLADDPPEDFISLGTDPPRTGIFAIVGENTAFPSTPQTLRRYRDFNPDIIPASKAGLLHVFLIELPNREVEWSSTKNLTPDEAYQAIQEMAEGEVAHLGIGRVSVYRIDRDLPRSTFDQLVDITQDSSDLVKSLPEWRRGSP